MRSALLRGLPPQVPGPYSLAVLATLRHSHEDSEARVSTPVRDQVLWPVSGEGGEFPPYTPKPCTLSI